MKEINKSEIEELIKDKSARIAVVRRSHAWFFYVYFGHYVSYPAADFHKEMFRLTEDESTSTLVVVAFRGSAKSTIFTMSYPIWAILGILQKKFVIILGQTQRQAKQHLVNIRMELENNELLRSDLGPFHEVEDEWGSYSLVIPKYNARITAASMEQTIRGMRQGQYRPDLIICDDIEDLQGVKTKEGRDKIHQWITGEVIPAGDRNTKMVFIGNLLHEDSLLMRLKDKIQNGELDGHFTAIPLIDDNDKISWPGKFPDAQAIEKENKKIANDIAWQREYMLRIVPEEGRIIYREWIQYYDDIKEDRNDLRYTLTGVDPAISKRDSADYTAIVSGKVYGYEDKQRIYILPGPINRRMNFPETLDELKSISRTLKSPILIESYTYQRVLAEQLQMIGFNAEAIDMGGNDKRSRLAMLSNMVKNGQIIFPRQGAEDLISQLVNFGIEKHDDLADALNVLVFKAIEDGEKPYKPEIFFIDYAYGRARKGLSFNDDEDD